VYKKAKQYYCKNKDKYDLVVDEINAKPFLTPKFVDQSTKILSVCHQTIGDIWSYETFFPLNIVCRYFLEPKWLSYYKEIPTITVSNSSREDLSARGFKKLFVVPQGVSISQLNETKPKESSPIIVFIGRLKKYKQPHHAISAFHIIKKHIPNAKMWVIGDGYMLKRLKKMNTDNDISFYGRIDNKMKRDLLERAHITISPSIHEGWGLVVIESNSMGTPVIAYDSPGLRDSIINGKTGILTDKSPESLAYHAISLLKDRSLLHKYSSSALEHSKQFSWDNTADAFDRIITEICGKRNLYSDLAIVQPASQ
jgi:glycosyltransferase involved in cell wall biosynthesis